MPSLLISRKEKEKQKRVKMVVVNSIHKPIRFLMEVYETIILGIILLY